MTFWLTALLVWMAAGARVGRVLVKPATTARMAIVVAVTAVAVAATVAVPEVDVALDHLLPNGIGGHPPAGAIAVSAWLLFAVATSVVAAAARPVVSRRNLRQIALVLYGLAVLAIGVTLVGSLVAGWAVTLLGCVFVVATGVRNLDWTALGRGIALYISATAAVGVLAALSIGRLTTHAAPARAGEPGWYWPVWQAASLLIALGAVWIVLELWGRARLLLRRIGSLHRVLSERFPEVSAAEKVSWSTQLRVSDQIAQIMDALYLQAGSGAELGAAGRPPVAIGARAARVACWIRDPLGGEVIDAYWIAPPPGLSPRGWVRALARAFDAGSPAAGSPAAGVAARSSSSPYAA